MQWLLEEFNRIGVWAEEQNAGNAFATQLAAHVRQVLHDVYLPPEEREP